MTAEQLVHPVTIDIDRFTDEDSFDSCIIRQQYGTITANHEYLICILYDCCDGLPVLSSRREVR